MIEEEWLKRGVMTAGAFKGIVSDYFRRKADVFFGRLKRPRVLETFTRIQRAVNPVESRTSLFGSRPEGIFIQPVAARPSPLSATPSPLGATRRCALLGGAAGSAGFLLVVLVQDRLKSHYDWTVQPVSALSNGDGGWVQRAAFGVAGLLYLLFAWGLRRGGTALGMGIIGIGALGAGVFSTDPAYGFPAGTPADYNEISTTGWLHFGFGFLGMLGGGAIAMLSARGHRLIGVAATVAMLVFFVLFAGAQGSAPAGIWERLAMFVLLGWVSWYSSRQYRAHGTRH